MIRFTALSTVLITALLALPVCRADLSIERVEVGFQGACRAGSWTPLAVVLSSDGDLPPARIVLETITADADGSMVRRSSGALAIERRGTEHVVRTVFQSGRAGSGLTVRLVDEDGRLLAEQRLAGGTTSPKTLPRNTTLWLVGSAFVAPDESSAPPVALPDSVVTAPIESELPSDPLAYEAIDLLLLRGDQEVTADQSEMLRRWVSSGGHLAIGLGRFTSNYRSGPLAQWVPIEVGEVIQLRDVSALENFPRRARVRIAQLDGGDTAFPPGLDTPLIAARAYGFGRVTLIAMDLDAPPFSNWSGLTGLLQSHLVDSKAVAPRHGSRTTPGVGDLSTQWIRAASALPGVGSRSVGKVLLLLLLLMVIVGPLDYLLVHRLLHRPVLTWLTLPLIVVFVSTSLYRQAAATNGTVSQFRQVHLLDVDVATQTVRGRTELALYAADSLRVDLTVTPRRGSEWGAVPGDEDAAATHLAWLAPPEETLGGTYREASGSLFRPEYSILNADAAARSEDIPMLAWSSRNFVVTWQRNPRSALVEPELVSPGRGRLEGTLRHRLAGPLSNILLAFEDHVYVAEPGVEWYPGDSLPLSSQFRRQDLVGRLTRQTTTRVLRKPGEGGENFIVSETTYNPAGTDLSEIMTMLTFHDAAGGRGYTGLTNVDRGRDDLSSHLRSGRAVLLAELDAPISDVAVTDEADTGFEQVTGTTFVRFVLPVGIAGSGGIFAPLAPTEKTSMDSVPAERPPRS